MNSKILMGMIRCEDNAEKLIFERTVWDDGDEMYEFSIVDDYIGGSGYHGLFGRIRRAWHAFRDKPIYYAGIVVNDKERARKFLNECLEMLDDKIRV